MQPIATQQGAPWTPSNCSNLSTARSRSSLARIDKAKTADAKQKLFDQVADSLAVHAAIEEHQFYPAVRAKRTEDILLEALEEHVGIKRVIKDLMDIDADNPTFDAKNQGALRAGRAPRRRRRRISFRR